MVGRATHGEGRRAPVSEPLSGGEVLGQVRKPALAEQGGSYAQEHLSKDASG